MVRTTRILTFGHDNSYMEQETIFKQYHMLYSKYFCFIGMPTHAILMILLETCIQSLRCKC